MCPGAQNSEAVPETKKPAAIEAGREAGASEDEAEFDTALKRMARPAKVDRGGGS